MFISVFDVFKIGIGPSSSHTMGPMTASAYFLSALRHENGQKVTHIRVSLYGSLSFTGRGHASDLAVILGLMGYTPETLDPEEIETHIEEMGRIKRISSHGLPVIRFDPAEDLVFETGPPLPGHANGMKFFGYDKDGKLLIEKIYYSIGGGFVVDASGGGQGKISEVEQVPDAIKEIPYPFCTATEMLEYGMENNHSILEMKRANELVSLTEEDLGRRLDDIWKVMWDCMERGLTQKGFLPGKLNVKRRAGELHEKLQVREVNEGRLPHFLNDYLCLYAIAVNEENASAGKMVTAPTNGAAGVIPAVLRCYLEFYPNAQKEDVRDFLLVAAAIGGIIKHNGSISGAEVGCQGEVGTASAMAAAGLCAVLGGSNGQIENSAEIALEHHLGLTCDPIGGLVQIPCIERNGFGAVKAVTAASLALQGDGNHFVSLDNCIKTMYDTGLDMNEKYKETSKGGLAVNVVAC